MTAPTPGGHAPAIGDYGFLSDCSSAALVSTGGSVDWWCLPRFDSPSVFGRLLDPDAGYWQLAPDGEFSAERDYVEDSLVLRTVFRTGSGAVAVTDALALQPGARGHDIGLRSPHVLLRVVEGLEGSVDLRTTVAPRFEYGLTVPRWRSDDDAWSAHVGPVALRLTGDVELAAEAGDLTGAFVVRPGERAGFCLACTPPYEDDDGPAIEPEGGLRDTVVGWQSWAAEHRGYQGRHLAAVRRSALVLQGLTYQKTGAVAAAATTSLPEQLGGELNWDYRFVWLRDISLTLQALWVAACPDEADRFFDWLASAVGHVGEAPLQIMYGVEGERDLTEHDLDHLAGYRGSRPVRVGNDAWKQRQLDVLGEILFAAHLLRDQLAPLSESIRDLLLTLADQAVRDWRLPGAGMWEARDEPRHYTSGKVMCWVALDRAIALADDLGDGARPREWARAREEIRDAVLGQAWSEQAGAYAGAFGSDDLDASVLLMPLVGFLPADDPRMLATIEAVRDRLGDGRLVRRWAGDTAGFVICSFWLVECLALAGEVDEADEWFTHLLGCGNDLGLFAEEVDPATGEQLGNYPQAFSHVGLVNAAWRLTECTSGEDLEDVQ
ncbi:Glucoamylase (glucan-1,4-alpha-glucosidase), GH15 family [Blastococcus sp. DSM 46786]|uniref:glycoside hydrolase family 15 protein n=1 Tax=Blastococcus sp. DSM 46786 TaxID=1798227 RepID=UPI0008D8307B|nr:glycoside hydrolase family 15 protein [Blastococcus sp. DSM 46786]SEL47315.1 Glucoamylase (glucan-1,4-alpha-glucosidase), GH15 family [Blastococcus sp. DSM 46786]